MSMIAQPEYERRAVDHLAQALAAGLGTMDPELVRGLVLPLPNADALIRQAAMVALLTLRRDMD